MQQLTFLSSPSGDLLGVDVLRQCSDGVAGRMELGGWGAGPDGRTAVGALGVFADEVLGYALMASLPQGAWSISTEIWLDVVGDLPGVGASLTGHAVPLQPGAFSRGELRDAAGRVVVECRQRGRRAEAPVSGQLESMVAVGPVRSQGGADGLATLLGMRDEGDTQLVEVHATLANPRKMLHGGVSLACSEVAATRSRLRSGCLLPTSSIHIVHTRGVPVGDTVVFHAETRHAGRTLWVTEVVGTVGGRVCTVATVTAQG